MSGRTRERGNQGGGDGDANVGGVGMDELFPVIVAAVIGICVGCCLIRNRE